jgi:hypothetical protein
MAARASGRGHRPPEEGPTRGPCRAARARAARARGAGDTVAGTPRRAVRVHAREGVGARPSGLRRAKGAEDEERPRSGVETGGVSFAAYLLGKANIITEEPQCGRRAPVHVHDLVRFSSRAGCCTALARLDPLACHPRSYRRLHVHTLQRQHLKITPDARLGVRPAKDGEEASNAPPPPSPRRRRGASSPSSPSSDPTRHPRTPFRCPGRADPGEGTA